MESAFRIQLDALRRRAPPAFACGPNEPDAAADSAPCLFCARCSFVWLLFQLASYTSLKPTVFHYVFVLYTYE